MYISLVLTGLWHSFIRENNEIHIPDNNSRQRNICAYRFSPTGLFLKLQDQAVFNLWVWPLGQGGKSIYLGGVMKIGLVRDCHLLFLGICEPSCPQLTPSETALTDRLR